jgi:hypothetical protein
MGYRVLGSGLHGPLEYAKEDLADAAHTARKMVDNGVDDVRVLDDDGREVDISNASLPPGWRTGP